MKISVYFLCAKHCTLVFLFISFLISSFPLCHSAWGQALIIVQQIHEYIEYLMWARDYGKHYIYCLI